jgi:hypothetical protein
VAVDAHPKHTMALGAAYVAERQREATAGAAGAAAAGGAGLAAGTPLPDHEPEPEAEPVAATLLTGGSDGVRARRMLPIGLALVAVAAVATIAIAANMFGGSGGGAASSPSVAPSVAVVASESPSIAVASPSPSALPSATPSPEPTATPAPTPTPTPAGRQARISKITVSGGRYVVDYDVFNFDPELPGRHVHFFFDTVPPEEAGVPGRGPWILYAGPVPFTQYKVSDKPSGANQMCILVARMDHSVIQDTGNCVDLPS